MKVIHIIPSIEAEASGPSYSVPALHAAMISEGIESHLAVTGSRTSIGGNHVHVFPRKGFPYKLGRSPQMYRWLREMAADGGTDVFHTHSLWMMPNIYPGWIERSESQVLVVSPRGTLSDWAMGHSRRSKELMWKLLQRPAIETATMFHATSEEEYNDIRRRRFNQPVAVIPNGIDLPVLRRETVPGAKNLLFLGRIHPIKGLDMLLEAWARMQSDFPHWRLSLVGPGEDKHVREITRLAENLRLERWTMAGPLYGELKAAALAGANLLVLPTRSENFGMAVAEALAAGCPVVTTKGAPWSGLLDHDAGWWTDIDVSSLQSALAEAMSLPAQELSAMGARGRTWMEREFSWQRVAVQMLEAYQWASHGGTKPTWVYT